MVRYRAGENAATRCLVMMVLLAASGCQRSADNFESTRLLVCEGNFHAAIPKLETYSGPHESRAGLFLGKCWMGLNDYVKARNVFEATIRDFPESVEAHKCRYKLAVLSFLEGDQESAREQFQRIADRRDGPLVAEAAAFAQRLSE